MENARMKYKDRNVMYDQMQGSGRINRELIFTDDEIHNLITMKPITEDNGSINFIASDDTLKRRKQLLNKLKKKRHKEKKKR